MGRATQSALESVAERSGVDAPLAVRAFDHCWLAGGADVDRLHRHGTTLRPCDPER